MENSQFYVDMGILGLPLILFYFGFVHYRGGITWNYQMKIRDNCAGIFTTSAILGTVVAVLQLLKNIFIGFGKLFFSVMNQYPIIGYIFWSIIIGTLLIWFYYELAFTSTFNTAIRDVMDLPNDASSDTLLICLRPYSKDFSMAKSFLEKEAVIDRLIEETANYPIIQGSIISSVNFLYNSWGYKYLKFLESKMN